MSNVVKMGIDAHSSRGMLQHLATDSPTGGALITRVGNSWEWRYYGDVAVVELVGAMEMVKLDLQVLDRDA